jgi:hypothetical protein
LWQEIHFALETKKAGPWLTLLLFVVKRKGELILPEPPPSREAQEAAAHSHCAGGNGTTWEETVRLDQSYNIEIGKF